MTASKGSEPATTPVILRFPTLTSPIAVPPTRYALLFSVEPSATENEPKATLLDVALALFPRAKPNDSASELLPSTMPPSTA